MRKSDLGLALSSAAILLGCLGGCSVNKNLDEMHDATVDMKKQTDALGKTSGEIRDVSRDMYGDLRPDNALKQREEQKRDLLQAISPAEKLSHAAKYHMAFEVQIWSPRDPNPLARRADLAASAAREFYREIQSLAREDQTLPPEPLAKATDSRAANRLASINALAATMHIIFDKQKDLLALNPGLPELSLLTMTKEALRASVEIRIGRKTVDDYPPFVKEILIFERQAIYMMQARHNYVATIALGFVSDLPWASSLGIGWNLICNNWTADFAALNDVQLHEFTAYLIEARATRDFLTSVGVVPGIDRSLRQIFANLQGPSVPQERAPTAREGKVLEFMTEVSILTAIRLRFTGSGRFSRQGIVNGVCAD